MTLSITPSGEVCGASVGGPDLAQQLDEQTVADIRATWLEHHVLAFPDQHLSDDDLERFTQYFGPFGDDPYIAPIPGRMKLSGQTWNRWASRLAMNMPSVTAVPSRRDFAPLSLRYS